MSRPYEEGLTGTSTAGYSVFPAYSQLHFPMLPSEGAVLLHVQEPSTLGIVVTTGPRGRRPGHFCLDPHVAMRIGLYLHRPSLSGASRAVSEDPRMISSMARLRCFP